MLVLLAPLFLVSTVSGATGSPQGFAPEFYCRNTNTSIYAEVCSPDFAENVAPNENKVKIVVDDEFCFDEVTTICKETVSSIEREICTYEYTKEEVATDCRTTKITFEERSESMKQTTCSPSGYGNLGYNAGDHQYCREEVQTQAYKVPVVTVPVVGSCMLSYPAPKRVCIFKPIDITEVKCEDKIAKKCFNVAKFADSTITVDEKTITTGQPKCDQFTLTLPTQACTRAPAYPGPGYSA